MVSFPKYENYKNSGIKWIGEIPSHWTMETGRTCLKPQKKKNTGNKVSTVLSLSYGKIVIKPEEKLHGLVPESFDTYQIVEPGNIIIRSTDLQNDRTSLRIGLVQDDGIITSAYLCLNPSEKMDSKYTYYLLHAYDLLKVYYGMGSGLRQNLDHTDFKYLPLPIPPIEEQDKIVEFLDRKTAEIDQAIEQKQRLIKLLKEQKAILIDRAVTKGLNPNVPMRDSGVDWIGEIPEHWDISRISFIGKVGNGSTPNRSNLTYWSNASIPWLNSSKVNDVFILFAEQFVTEKAVHECHLPIVEPNSLVIAITGEGKTRGTAAICKIRTTINQHLAYIQIQDKRICPEFLHLYLQGMYEWMRSESSGNGSTKGAITCDDIKKYKVPVPPLEEQRSILSTVYQYTHGLDEVMKKNFEGIEQLNYFKQVLVSETVTGKLKASNDI